MLHWLTRWPLIQQILTRSDGTGIEAMSRATRSLHARTAGAEVTPSVCPYCAVGCGQLIYHDGGRLTAIEGDPASFINEGTLCPKGSATFELLTHSQRLSRVLYRAPRSTAWTELNLDQAVDMVADRLWESRRRTFVTEVDGVPVNHTTSIAHLGGATLDNEENYLIKKLFTAGLGMVCISNQARL